MASRIVAVIATAFALLAAVDMAAADGGSSAGGAEMTQAGEIYVKRGYRGPGVMLIQRKLGIAADGVFGSMTERAVKRFQRRHGLVPDGVVGPLTRRALGIDRFSRGSVYRRGAGIGSGLPRVLRRIAECESGGDPTAVSPDGRYRGKFQFTRETWRRLGGEGDPATAPEWLQNRLALRLYRQSGTAPWPACSRG